MTAAAVNNKNIAWLGDFPSHWHVLRIKNLFQEVDNRSETGSEELLSVSHYTGVTLKRESLESDDEYLTNAESLVGYKMVEPGDLVVNITLAWNGSMGISPHNGITSLPIVCIVLRVTITRNISAICLLPHYLKPSSADTAQVLLIAAYVYTPINSSAFFFNCAAKGRAGCNCTIHQSTRGKGKPLYCKEAKVY